MEKLTWVKPEMEEVCFAADEYVAACGEEEQVYSFICDAGGGDYGGLYDMNWNLKSNDTDSFHACSEVHDAPLDGTFYDGYFDPDTNHGNANEIRVKIWEEKWLGIVYDRHATTQTTLTIAKS